jgi:hypothetical protein
MKSFFWFLNGQLLKEFFRFCSNSHFVAIIVFDITFESNKLEATKYVPNQWDPISYI